MRLKKSTLSMVVWILKMTLNRYLAWGSRKLEMWLQDGMKEIAPSN